MPTGVRELRIFQIGRETTKGTGVAATYRMVGGMMLVKPDAQVRMPDPQIGVLIDHPTSDVITLQRTNIEIGGDLTYEQIILIANMALKGVTTPTGAGADKTWTFNPIFTADNALNSYTLERRLHDGTTTWDEEVNYVLCEDFELSGNVGEIATYRANLFGRKLDRASTLTGAIAVPAVNYVSCADVKMYVDNTFGGLGTTQVTSLISWKVGCRGQYQPKQFQDGRANRDFATHSIKKIGYDLTATVEWDAVINGERVKADDRSIRYVRIEAVGAVLGGSNYKLTVDMALRYADGMFDQEGERDNNDTVDLEFVDAYDSTNLIGIKLVAVNALTTHP